MTIDYDQLALEVANDVLSEVSDTYAWDFPVVEFARRYRKALKEKMEPQLWVSTASGKTANFKFLPIAVPLYSLEDWK